MVDGEYFEVSCAVAADHETSPASDLLDSLAGGTWEDPHAESLPDAYQPKLRTRLLAHVNQLANEGELPPHAYNRLQEGIWELKVESIRATFYDTDGEGSWSPKLGERVSTWDGYRWELPEDFDEFLRLGHCFPKDSQKTSEADIEASIRLREEDVDHDRESGPAAFDGSD